MIIESLKIIGPLVFIAGFIDAIAGGGGLISLPAYVLANIPMHVALGTNKLASSLGTLVASLQYGKERLLIVKLIIYSVIFAFFGALLGSRMTLFFPDRVLKSLMVFVLPLMAFAVLRKKKEVSFVENINYFKAALVTFIVGFYDGFLGPGTGSILVFFYVTVCGLNYTQSSAHAKVVNLTSNVVAAGTFLYFGKVWVELALYAAVFSMLGNYLGSKVAIKNGAKVIRPVLIGVFSLLIVKLAYDLWILT